MDYLHRCDFKAGFDTEKYRDSSFFDWTGIDEDTIRKDLLDEYNSEDSIKYYYWDKEKKYPYYSIVSEIGYWRKVNSVHRWFVENVQNGTDNCRNYEVTKEQLENLLNICEQIIDNPEEAKNLMPTSSGFFFGTYDYDDWYFEGIASTVEIIKSVLNNTNFEHEIVFYHSSW